MPIGGLVALAQRVQVSAVETCSSTVLGAIFFQRERPRICRGALFCFGEAREANAQAPARVVAVETGLWTSSSQCSGVSLSRGEGSWLARILVLLVDDRTCVERAA